LVEISKKKEPNEQERFICSRTKDKLNDGQGWTTIEANRSRKPKSKNSKQATIDSIITSINIELITVKNGATEARIASPVRENRCTIPDESGSTRTIEFKPTKNRKQQLAPPEEEEEEEEEESQDQDVTKDVASKRRNTQSRKIVSHNVGARSNNTRSNEDRKVEGRSNKTTVTAATSKEEESKAIRTTTITTNGSPEVNQLQTSNGAGKESNNRNKINDDNNKESGGGKQKVSIVLPAKWTQHMHLQCHGDQNKKQGRMEKLP
jgi:hypothetical protein